MVLYDIIQIFGELKEFKDQKVAYFFIGLILYDQIENVLLPKMSVPGPSNLHKCDSNISM